MNQIIISLKKAYRYAVKKELLISIIVGLSLIIGGVYLGYINNKVVPINPAVNARYSLEPNNKLSFMSNWDGPDYISIVDHGYTNSSVTNFFPLYPAVTYGIKTVVRSSVDSALIVSWICLIGAIYFYIKIIKILFKEKDPIEALKGVVFFILFPTGIFLLATYTESLFALLALAAIYHALRNKYILAGIFTFLACLTHISGVFLVVLIFLLLMEQKVNIKKSLASAIIGGLGLVTYMTYLFIRFNNPLAFISAQKNHGWLKHSVGNITSTIDWLNLIFIILIIVSAIYWWHKRKSFSIYSLLYLTIPLAGGQFGGFNRYMLMDFPIQIMLYNRFKQTKLAYSICLSISAVIWAYFLFQYAGGYVGG